MLPYGAVALASLDLSENGMSPEGVQWVTTLPGLGKLVRLVLDRNEIGNGGAALLSRWSGAASLQSLSLLTNRIGDSGARSLARSRYLHQLVELDLSDNPIHDQALSFLNSALPPQRPAFRTWDDTANPPCSRARYLKSTSFPFLPPIMTESAIELPCRTSHHRRGEPRDAATIADFQPHGLETEHKRLDVKS
jgi:hypothetical protein